MGTRSDRYNRSNITVNRYRQTRPGGKLIGVLLFALVPIIALSACSSSGSSQSSTGAASSSASSSASGSSSAGVAAATKAAAQAAAVPDSVTNISITTPLKSAPTPGLWLASIYCNVTACSTEAQATDAAAAAIGWKVHNITYDAADPSTYVTAMQAAIRYKPVAIISVGVDQSTWAGENSALIASKIPLIMTTNSPTFTGGVDVICVQCDNAPPGQILANWFISNSHGTGHALLLTYPSAYDWLQLGNAFVQAVSSGCSKCAVTQLPMTPSALAQGQTASEIVSKLRDDPSINYVISTSGSFTTGLSAAMNAAGLEGKVQVACGGARSQNLTDIQTGTTEVCVNQPLSSSNWMAVDAAARISEGMTLPTATYITGSAFGLITKSNMPPTSSASVDYPADYAAQYKKLWLVG